MLERIPGYHVLRRPKLFSYFREDEFCEFEVEGMKFVVWEPYGDNSRYWIGPQPPRWVPQIAQVRQAFIDKAPFPPLWVRVAVIVVFVAIVALILLRSK